MRHQRLVLVCLIVLGVFGVSARMAIAEGTEAPREFRAYLVGNSLIRSITPTRLHELMAEKGIDFQFGSQLKGGTGLTGHWEALQKGVELRYWESNKPVGDGFEPGRPDGDTLPKRFGSYLTANKGHKWDAVVLQPYVYSPKDMEGELKAFGNFVDYAIEHDSAKQIYLYTSWLRRPLTRGADGRINGLGPLNFSEVWEGDGGGGGSGGGGHMVRQNYRSFLKTVNQRYVGKLDKPILMIPFGDVMCELDKRIKAGKIPGIEELAKRDPERVPNWDAEKKTAIGAVIFYADRSHPVKQPHLDGTIGNYVMGLMYYAVLTGKSPVGLSGEAYDFGDARDEGLRKALQEAVWDVVKGHDYTGVAGD